MSRSEFKNSELVQVCGNVKARADELVAEEEKLIGGISVVFMITVLTFLSLTSILPTVLR